MNNNYPNVLQVYVASMIMEALKSPATKEIAINPITICYFNDKDIDNIIKELQDRKIQIDNILSFFKNIKSKRFTVPETTKEILDNKDILEIIFNNINTFLMDNKNATKDPLNTTGDDYE